MNQGWPSLFAQSELYSNSILTSEQIWLQTADLFQLHFALHLIEMMQSQKSRVRQNDKRVLVISKEILIMNLTGISHLFNRADMAT